jgi:hypothetical protein
MKLAFIFVTTLSAIIFSSAPSTAEDFKLDLFWQGNIIYSEGKSQAPTSGFSADFKPSGGSMTIDNQGSWGLDVRFGIEPSWQIQDRWRVGIVTWYNLAGYSFNSDSGEQDFFSMERIVSESSLDWWDDVTAVDLLLKTNNPAIGLSVAKDRLKFAYAVQRYDLIRRDYKGIDHYGAQNESTVKSKIKLDDGLGQIFHFWCQDFDSLGRDNVEYGFFYEKYGSYAWFAGLGVRFNFKFSFQ